VDPSNDFTCDDHSSIATVTDEPRAFRQQRYRSLLIKLRHLSTTARVMDGRGVVPILSLSDVETAAQVLHPSSAV